MWLFLWTSAFGQACDPAYADACVSPDAQVDPLVAIGTGVDVQAYALIGPGTELGDGAFVGARAVVTGWSAPGSSSWVGDGSVLSRRVFLGADVQVEPSVTLSRAVRVGDRGLVMEGASVGYASVLGPDVTVWTGATLGSLVQVAHDATIRPTAVLAREVQIGANSTVGGIVGPGTQIGERVTVLDGARIRKQAQIGDDVEVEDGVRIGRGAIIQDGVVLDEDVVVGAGATVMAGSEVPPETVIPRNSTFMNACQAGDAGCPALSCQDVLDQRGSAASGPYWVDPDNGGAIEVYCDMQTAGGGWMMVLNREAQSCCDATCSPLTTTTHATGIIDPSTPYTAVQNADWARLRDASTESMVVGQTSTCSVDVELIADIAALQGANCEPLATDLTDPVIAHQEDSGCSYQNQDYTVWLGVSNNFFSDLATPSLFTSSNHTGAYLDWGYMYVR